MSGSLIVRDLLPGRKVDQRLFRQILRVFFDECLERELGEVAIYLVDSAEMTRLNETFLGHAGPTDVITFDYSAGGAAEPLCGEVFICPAVARAQARRFRVTWQSEVVRYAIHGVLHLWGHDDRRPADRALMKRAENKHLSELAARFDFRKLAPATSRR